MAMMSMATNGVAMSGGVGAALKTSLSDALEEFKRQHSEAIERSGGLGEHSRNYLRIEQDTDKLGVLLRNAIRQDKKDAFDFWTEVKEALQHGFNYFGDRREFDARCQKIVESAERALEIVGGLVERFVDKKDAPDEVRKDYDAWKNVAERLKTTTEPIPGFGTIPNWSGPASEEYRAMTDVQVEACRELVPRVDEIAQCLKFVEGLNQGTLSAGHGYVQLTQGKMSTFPSIPSDRFYVRTATCAAELTMLAHRLTAVLPIAEGAAAELKGSLEQIESSVSVVSSGWPTGTSQHGQRGVAAPEIKLDIPDYDAPGRNETAAAQDGTRR